VVEELEKPSVFNAPLRPDLIKFSFDAYMSHQIVPYGPSPLAGRDNTATYVGSRRKPANYRLINIGVARKPRLKNRRYLWQGRVAGIPGVVGGPRAHPPKPYKDYRKKINKKQRLLALFSGFAATSYPDLVKERGHKFEAEDLPIVVDSFDSFSSTREVVDFLKKVGLYEDVERAKKRKKVRAGKGKMRNRPYKRAKSILFITKNDFPYGRNLEGADVVNVKDLNIKDLAPGGKAGRLVVIEKEALLELDRRYSNFAE